jgi:hypothetical protein
VVSVTDPYGHILGFLDKFTSSLFVSVLSLLESLVFSYCVASETEHSSVFQHI